MEHHTAKEITRGGLIEGLLDFIVSNRLVALTVIRLIRPRSRSRWTQDSMDLGLDGNQDPMKQDNKVYRLIM